MTQLAFRVVGARAEPYAAVPTLMLRLRVDETSGEKVHALALRAQVQIEPRRRHYDVAESAQLFELFGEPGRFGDTLRTLLWTHVQVVLPGFQGSTEVDLPIVCTYDFEVAAAKYLQALAGGEIPLLLLFSGTVFVQGETGFSVEPVSWDKEAAFALPVAVWRGVMDRYFPDSAWLRLRRDSFEALYRFKSERSLPTWEAAVEALLSEVDAGKPA